MRITTFLLLAFILLLLLGCCQTGKAQSDKSELPRSMKGYELYSWKFRREWYFSLLVGTNRQKTLGEIISPKVRLKGVAALKKKLSRLPKGSEVIFSTGHGSIPQLVFPPRPITEEILLYCRQHRIVCIVPPVRTSFSHRLFAQYAFQGFVFRDDWSRF